MKKQQKSIHGAKKLMLQADSNLAHFRSKSGTRSPLNHHCCCVNAFQNVYVLVYTNALNFQMRKIFISIQDWHYAHCFIHIFSDMVAKEIEKFRVHMSERSLVSRLLEICVARKKNHKHSFALFILENGRNNHFHSEKIFLTIF